MDRENFEMWILVSREYNEDPLFKTMSPAKWLAARRTTILVFSYKESQLKRLAVSRYSVGKFFESAWDRDKQPDQWERLSEIIQELDPKSIALNFSDTFALADGLTLTEHSRLNAVLSKPYMDRVSSGERLAVGWLETRIPEEMEVYPTLCRIAHEIIAEGLSNKVIQPGHTTTSDVEWWFRERIRELRLTTWFHTSVSIQRHDPSSSERSFAERPETMVIHRGDLLHVDFGISYLGLNTDTQQHAYVLKPGEEDGPEGLRKALAEGNRLQDILLSEFKLGSTGNEVLSRALDKARTAGLQPSIYTHPLGFHGHAAGPTIGMWDQQDGVPGGGDYPLFSDTAYSIELNVTSEIPEWDNQKIRIMLEEDALLSETGIRFLDGRQTDLILIR
jgi:Xaa-Pro aminopeptidase